MQSWHEPARSGRGAAVGISGTVLLALASAFAVPSLEAAEWSRARILSGVGQPLNVEVPLRDVPRHATAAQYQVSLEVATANSAAMAQRTPLPVQHTLEPAADGSGFILMVVSDAPVEQGVVELHLSVDGPEAPAARRVVLLLSPGHGARVVPVSLAQEAIGSGVQVRAGDTLGEIAVRVRQQAGYHNVSMMQALAGLFHANPEAFIRNNMNLVKAGATLRIPSAEALRALDQATASQLYQRHLEAFRALRARGQLAPAVNAASEPAAALPSPDMSEGAVEPPPAPIPPPPERDTLRLSSLLPGNGEAQAATLDAQAQIDQLRDERAATQRALEAARSRVGELESTVEDMRRLLDLQNEALARLQEAASATAPAAEAAERRESQQQSPSSPAGAATPAARSLGAGHAPGATAPGEAPVTSAATTPQAESVRADAGSAMAGDPQQTATQPAASTNGVAAPARAATVTAEPAETSTAVSADAEPTPRTAPAAEDSPAAAVSPARGADASLESAPASVTPAASVPHTDSTTAGTSSGSGSGASSAEVTPSASAGAAEIADASATASAPTASSATANASAPASSDSATLAAQASHAPAPSSGNDLSAALTHAPATHEAQATSGAQTAGSEQATGEAPSVGEAQPTGEAQSMGEAQPLANLSPHEDDAAAPEGWAEGSSMPALRSPPPARPQDLAAQQASPSAVEAGTAAPRSTDSDASVAATAGEENGRVQGGAPQAVSPEGDVTPIAGQGGVAEPSNGSDTVNVSDGAEGADVADAADAVDASESTGEAGARATAAASDSQPQSADAADEPATEARELPWLGIGALAVFALLVIGFLFRRKKQPLVDDDLDAAETADSTTESPPPLKVDFDLDLDSPPSDEPPAKPDGKHSTPAKKE